jgi:hypothetical protein
MKSRFILSVYLIALIFSITGCSGSSNESANTSNTANTNINKGNDTNATVVTTKPPAPTTNDAPTLGPVMQAYYDALKKKDDAAVRQTMSADFIKRSEDGMKEEKEKSLTAYLSEYDTLPDKPLETRNEVITGDKGTAELRGGAYKNWTAFAFAKEGGKWKLTGGSPDIDNVKNQANSSK